MPRAVSLVLLLLLRVATAQEAPARAPDLRFAPQRWALVIGANDYEHLGALRYAREDARAFATALEQRLGFAPEAVRLLTDDADDPRLTPTAGHVLHELEALLRDPRRTSSDLFVFYFCGHGAGLEKGDYLLPTDADLESIERLGLPVREVVTRLGAVGMHNVLVVIDACREGEAHDFGRELEALATEARLGVALGCAPGAQSYEEARYGHGVFTHELLAALEDESLRDPLSGAQWFSRVAGAAQARVLKATTRRKPPQEPAVWCAPTRDVLLSAALVERPDGGDVASFLGRAQPLDTPAHAAALQRYADELAAAGRAGECVQVLKTAEQLAPLAAPSATLLYSTLIGLGRTGEAAAVLSELRARAPGTPFALIATVVDQSGAVSDAERSAAARELWYSVGVPYDVLLFMVQAHLRSGANAEALEVAGSALQQAPRNDADGAFLSAIVALLSGDPMRAAQELERAEGLDGGLLPREVLRRERIAALRDAGRQTEAFALLDRSVEEWPESGAWLALRAWLRRRDSRSLADLDAALADARQALEHELTPAELLLCVRAAGVGATRLAAEVARVAERFPLSWEAQVASVLARQPADMADEVAAAVRLSARPALAFAAMTDLTLQALEEEGVRTVERHGPDSPEVAAFQAGFDEAVPHLLQQFAPMAGELGADPQAWTLLSDLYRRRGQYEAFVRLFEHHLATQLEQGHVSDELALVLAQAWLNTGRFERCRSLDTGQRGAYAADVLAWFEAAYLATHGTSEAALARLEGRTQPVDPGMAPFAAPLLALLRARGGDAEGARAALRDLPLERDALTLALHYLALLAVGEDEAAARWLEELGRHQPQEGYFAVRACVPAIPGADPRLGALTVVWHPGNPLDAEASFLLEPSLDAFAAPQAYALEEVEGPFSLKGATLTLTATKTGKVVGALVGTAGEALVVQGTLDARGNFEARILGGATGGTLLAKLAPPRAFDEYPPLDQPLQPFTLLTDEFVPFTWLGRLQR